MITHINNITISNPNQFRQLRYKPATLYYLRITFPSTVTIGNGKRERESTGEIAGVGYYNPNSIYNSKDISNRNMQQNGDKIAGTSPLVLYKLGYTTTSLQERVYGKQATYYINKYGKRQRVAGHNGMGLPTNSTVHVISTYSNTNASLVYQYEQELHRKYASAKWQGLPVMENGNTELYISDILELDN